MRIDSVDATMPEVLLKAMENNKLSYQAFKEDKLPGLKWEYKHPTKKIFAARQEEG